MYSQQQLSPNSALDEIPEFLENHHHRASSRDRRVVNGSSYTHPLPTPRHSRSRPLVVVPTQQRTPARTSHRRASTTTATSSSTDRSSVFSQYVDSEFSASTAPSLGPDPNGEGSGFLPCEFVGHTRCDERYDLDDTEQWINHIINDHLRYQLPTICACWFCDDWVFDTEVNNLDDETNFRQRLYHIRDHITYNGYGISDIRPDYNFVAHLRSLGMISQNAYTAAMMHREGPQSDVTDIYPHNFVPPEQQYQQDRSASLVVTDSTREEKRKGRRDRRRQG